MAGSTTVPAASPSRAARAAPCPRHQGLRRHQPPALPTVIPRQAVRLRDRLCSRGGGWRRAEGIFQLPQVPVQLPCFRKRNLWKARRPVHSRRHFPHRSVDPDPDPVQFSDSARILRNLWPFCVFCRFGRGLLLQGAVLVLCEIFGRGATDEVVEG